MVVESEHFVFVAQEFGDGEGSALVDLCCVEGDEDVENEDGVEEGSAAGGGDGCSFGGGGEGWWVCCDGFCGGEEGRDGGAGEDVEEGEEGVDEADFFVGD